MELEFPPGATPIDTDEAEGLIPSLSTQAELNAFEAMNILEATRWAKTSRIIKNSLLTNKSLNLLHKRMFDKTWKWAGKYRITQKSIGVEAYQISTEVRILVDDVRMWMECKTFQPDEIATRFHHRLVKIHCYPNGNGRHSRLAADLLCRNQSWSMPTWGSENLVEPNETRRSYIQALRQADQGDYNPLIAFMYL